jgi:hypothetical protein
MSITFRVSEITIVLALRNLVMVFRMKIFAVKENNSRFGWNVFPSATNAISNENIQYLRRELFVVTQSSD